MFSTIHLHIKRFNENLNAKYQQIRDRKDFFLFILSINKLVKLFGKDNIKILIDKGSDD
jgi:hypothetical protein